MTPKQIAWLKLGAVAVGTGCTTAALAYAGGAKWGYCAVLGIGSAGSAVYHALSPSPNDVSTTNQAQPGPK